jgi:hypothetical protein
LGKKVGEIRFNDKAFLKDIDQLLNTFGDKKRKEILRKASTPLRKEMAGRPEFSDYTGEARESIKSMTWAKSPAYFVGPKKGVFTTIRKRKKAKTNLHDPFYMKFIEYGFNLKLRDGRTMYIPPTNFIQKSIDSSRNSVLEIISNLVKAELRSFR